MTSEAQKRASDKYDKENTVRYTIKLNKHTDADLIHALEKESNKQGFIKNCINRYVHSFYYNHFRDEEEWRKLTTEEMLRNGTGWFVEKR